MKSTLLAIVFGSLLAVVSLSHAQNAPVSLSELQKELQTGAEKVGQPTKAPTAADGDYALYRVEEESNRLILSLSVLGAGCLSLLLVLAFLAYREAAQESMVTGSGIVLVIFAVVLVVILAKTDQQLTAATGILGAFAGYLFGKAAKGPESESEAQRKPNTAGTT